MLVGGGEKGRKEVTEDVRLVLSHLLNLIVIGMRSNVSRLKSRMVECCSPQRRCQSVTSTEEVNERVNHTLFYRRGLKLPIA